MEQVTAEREIQGYVEKVVEGGIPEHLVLTTMCSGVNFQDTAMAKSRSYPYVLPLIKLRGLHETFWVYLKLHSRRVILKKKSEILNQKNFTILKYNVVYYPKKG